MKKTKNKKPYSVTVIKVLTIPPKNRVVALMNNKTFQCDFSNPVSDWESEQLSRLLEAAHNKA